MTKVNVPRKQPPLNPSNPALVLVTIDYVITIADKITTKQELIAVEVIALLVPLHQFVITIADKITTKRELTVAEVIALLVPLHPTPEHLT